MEAEEMYVTVELDGMEEEEEEMDGLEEEEGGVAEDMELGQGEEIEAYMPGAAQGATADEVGATEDGR